ncbi:hypothetical protein SH1V18_29820 [Vallitalea longa]|uniref:Uncharacterized protein n=1 Tax=Vallitalea longa TaxID=2936439 RepID=A0A9W5YAR1_9FIRM|nr:hypothetical protein [Vallitalea longa]GKX30502.1 hypothetical protein SH1V18_29820 [Vallitalea longa]
MKQILKKLTNTKTVLGITSAVILILTNLGLEVNNQQIMTIIKALCTIGILLGIMNDGGMKTTEWNH